MDSKELDRKIDAFEKELAKLKELRENTPKPVTLYLHSAKEYLFEEGETLGLTESQMLNFPYSLYEVSFEGVVNAAGEFVCESVNGVKLETPTVM